MARPASRERDARELHHKDQGRGYGAELQDAEADDSPQAVVVAGTLQSVGAPAGVALVDGDATVVTAFLAVHRRAEAAGRTIS